MLRRVLTRDHITPHLKQVLRLPEGTWQLVINQALTAASYMDGSNRVHHIEIDEARRQALRAIPVIRQDLIEA